MFFGLGLALTCLVAMNYFQSMIIPQTAGGWIFYLTTFIGHFGSLLALVYFLLYVPVVSVFPSYYVARIWSITLILAVNLFIFFDSYLFARFRFHMDSFLWTLLQDQEALSAFGLSSFKMGLVGFVTFILFCLMWFRGEKLWRSMQARFSNPVSNWYLAVIFLCLITGQIMHMYGEAKNIRSITRISSLFPMYVAIPGELLFDQSKVADELKNDGQGYRDFYYPREPLKCAMKAPKNILMIVMDKWNQADLNAAEMPNLHHYSNHGLVFTNHFSGGLDNKDGYFSLLYSLPPTYTQSVLNQGTPPVFLDQIQKAQMEKIFLQLGAKSPINAFQPDEKEISIDYLESSLSERKVEEVPKPFMMQVYLDSASLADKDNNVRSVIELFIKNQLIKDTIIIVTGAYSENVKTPLVVIWPGKGAGEVNKLTSHYDILPTIMIEDWNCKNSSKQFSLGQSLFSKETNVLHVAGNYQKLEILDFKDQTITTVDQFNGLSVRDLTSSEEIEDKRNIHSILKMLHKLTVFNQR